ncbi:hypothetical protein [Pelagibaculum spongiae]|uniref:Uncharacterized protein n=1 Tax=Pelagibaculum spongiae TaxID=2080658 RepID=A0A2V1GW44_9GAMM|nr:hypothetical protein [Pelagibaculum spongiae]PVZ70625.1 hypothetical protein DC094_08595 [Pelagibaculum spongiae]
MEATAPNLIDDLEWVVLTLPTHQANISAATQIRKMGFKGKMAATTSYADEKEKLESLGVHYTFNVFTEAGYGFANELKKMKA